MSERRGHRKLRLCSKKNYERKIVHVTVARVLNLSPLNYPFVDTINRGTVADL